MVLFRLSFLAALATDVAASYSPRISSIIKQAKRGENFNVPLQSLLHERRDGPEADAESANALQTHDLIDLESLPFASAAFVSIDAIQNGHSNLDLSHASRVDTHVHIVPDFYLGLVLTTGQSPTPSHLQEHHIHVHAGLDGFHDNEAYSVGLAKLLNEWLAELRRAFPKRFEFYAVMPLPYTPAAIKEAKYALTSLGAIGLGLLTNHEGLYLGNAALAPFFAALNATVRGPHVCIVHPSEPLIRINGTLVVADPTKQCSTALYLTGQVEFYFETARALMDLTVSRTITNYTNIHYAFGHVNGAFPSIEHRFIKTIPGFEQAPRRP
ncbi:hypothetical protein B0T24DRAFT_592685 [Lasiosphaeria ovina]|uniref:Amidohydrolase-related domain-containing protein n=1 Tax=Lasiosphaeria ovina TaxID=92902 RepID=A0AAE0NC00_9PEZI|nr:hypothetical protein B0T24DRAFT_592685 [Lasiosphaeria ovina]